MEIEVEDLGGVVLVTINRPEAANALTPSAAESAAAARTRTAQPHRRVTDVTVSSGGMSPKQKVTLGEGFQLPLAAAVRRAAGLPVMGVGMLFDPLHANRAIAEGRCDLAAIARGMLHDPHSAWRAAAALGGDVSYPPQYIRGHLSSWLREQRAGHGGA